MENGEFRDQYSTTKALTGVDTSGWLLAPFLLENLTQGENAPVAENALVAQEKSTMEGDGRPFFSELPGNAWSRSSLHDKFGCCC